MTLIRRNESRDIFIRLGAVFGFSAVNSFAPHFKARRLHILAHNFDNFRFGRAELIFDCVKCRAVFPSHSDNSINFSFRHNYLFRGFGNSIRKPCLNRKPTFLTVSKFFKGLSATVIKLAS